FRFRARTSRVQWQPRVQPTLENCGMGLRPWAEGRTRTFVASLVVPARARPDLFFRVLFPAISNSRPHRAPGHSARGRIPCPRGGTLWPAAILVCSNALVVGERPDRAQFDFVCGPAGLGSPGREPLAA